MEYTTVKKHIRSTRGCTYYWISKKENALALVMLPGLAADHRLFERQIDEFISDYSVLVWDCPCHGDSRPYDDFTFSNIIHELKNILDMEGIRKAVFIGHSLGGLIAQCFIDTYPNMALGLISIDSVPLGDYYSKFDYFWLHQLGWMSHLCPNKVLRKSMAKMCGTTYYTQRKMLDILSIYTKKELCHLLNIGVTAFIAENHEVTLTCPVILVLGEKDNVVKFTQYNKEWSLRTGYPLHITTGAAHNSNEDCPVEVNWLIREFLINL